MQTYRDFRPTGFDRHIEMEEIEDFFVILARNRDSTILENCNFETAVEWVGGESEQVQVHRFGHWGCGWFELLLVHPDKEIQAEEIEASLAYYPVLDDQAYSAVCMEAIYDYWEHMGLKERMHYCKRAGESIFGARGETPSDRVYQELNEEIY